MALIIPLWMLLIFSPFVAFTVNGKVDDSNWTPAFVTAGLCIAALVAINLRAAQAYRALPRDLRDEYKFGRLFMPVAGNEAGSSNCAYGTKINSPPVVEMDREGVVFAPSAMIGASYGAARHYGNLNMFAHLGAAARVPVHPISWSDVEEWQVHDDSDNPDFYRLVLRDGGHVELRRPRDAVSERRVLDFVRTTGQRPVRLFCDIE